jgi:hypothetical protein
VCDARFSNGTWANLNDRWAGNRVQAPHCSKACCGSILLKKPGKKRGRHASSKTCRPHWGLLYGLLGPTVTRCNYRAELLVLNVVSFVPFWRGEKCLKVLGQSRNVPRKHVAGICGTIAAKKQPQRQTRKRGWQNIPFKNCHPQPVHLRGRLQLAPQ